MTQHTHYSLSIKIRSVLFFVLYNLAGIIHSFFCVLIGPFLPYRRRYQFVNLWTRFAMWLLKLLNGVRIKVEGQDNLPPAPSWYWQITRAVLKPSICSC